jgi:hypothetical protein
MSKDSRLSSGWVGDDDLVRYCVVVSSISLDVTWSRGLILALCHLFDLFNLYLIFSSLLRTTVCVLDLYFFAT